MTGKSFRAFSDWRLSFGEIRHRRHRPVEHAFRYASFFVRVPVHQLDGRPAGNPMFGLNRRALLSFRERDHGAGGAALPWIRGLLNDAGIRVDGEIWLHAFPRVLGYAFKPVSFWFCHDRSGECRAIVVEVNNTFGERHCYLLAAPGGAPMQRGAELLAMKTFHVSPFCDVSGSYRFRFFDNDARSLARIDHDDDTGTLLTTSISGRHAPLDLAGCTRALLGHPLFTFGVVARIHWQALRLWLRRVPFHRKPAPPARSVSNN